MGGKCDNKEGDLYRAHPFPRLQDIGEGVTLQRLGCSNHNKKNSYFCCCNNYSKYSGMLVR